MEKVESDLTVSYNLHTLILQNAIKHEASKADRDPESQSSDEMVV